MNKEFALRAVRQILNIFDLDLVEIVANTPKFNFI